MNVIILAGGHATRLWPITRNRAKPLLPLGEKPIIDYIVEDTDPGDRIIISTNRKFEQDFQEYAAQKDRNIEVFVEDQKSETNKPGTIGGILKILNEYQLSDEDLLVIGGDNYFSFNLQELKDFSSSRGTSLAAYRVPIEDATDFGIIKTRDDLVTAFEEKPENPGSNLASTACYYFESSDIPLFEEYEEYVDRESLPKKEYLDAPGMFIEWLVDQTDVYGFGFDGAWFDIGTPDGYLDAASYITDDDVVEGQIENTELSDCLILEGAEITGSELEKCIVFPGAKIEDSNLENTIVGEDARVRGKNLSDSVIGDYSTVE